MKTKIATMSQFGLLALVVAGIVMGCSTPRTNSFTPENTLIQTGEARFLGTYESRFTPEAIAFYPVPYESPPHLRFPDAEHRLLTDLNQTAEGFSVRINSETARGTILRWEAEGLPKKVSAP